MKHVITIGCLILGSMCYSQNINPDTFFIEAANNLLQQNLEKSDTLFQMALHKYKSDNNQTGVHNCYMGIGTLYVMKGDFAAALRIYNRLKDEHLRCCKEQTSALEIIEDCINRCLSEIRKLDSAKKSSS